MGGDERLRDVAYAVGRELGERRIRLVYGAGGLGLMGVLADGALAAGGEVIGVIPRAMLQREWGREDLTELHVCDTMHQRKAIMADNADAFLALPGGLGTLEEIFEVWTWRQIGFHAKPVGFLDVDGFWTPLLGALAGIRDAGLIRPSDLDQLVVGPDLPEVLGRLEDRLPPQRHTVSAGV